VEPINEDWQRAVAIVAHPDDLEYGAASAVARWTAQGKEVSYVLATSGEAGIAGLPPDQSGPLREEEQHRSATVVGVDHVEFLGHVDGAVEYGLPLRRDLAGALRRLRPEVVIGMNFDLTWGEGGSVNHADLGAPWGGVTSLYIAGTETATHYVDVSDTIGAGVASLREHRAYIEALGTDFDPDTFLRNIAGYAGMAASCEYAVLFQAFGVS
jgi:LmbE family N-acetylglucosaminyl deacetylase